MHMLELTGLVYPLINNLVSSAVVIRLVTREPLGGDIDTDENMSDAL